MATEITMRIAPNGDTTVSVKGVKGQSCKALTKEFEELLGAKVGDTETKEAYEREVVEVRSKA